MYACNSLSFYSCQNKTIYTRKTFHTGKTGKSTQECAKLNLFLKRLLSSGYSFRGTLFSGYSFEGTLFGVLVYSFHGIFFLSSAIALSWNLQIAPTNHEKGTKFSSKFSRSFICKVQRFQNTHEFFIIKHRFIPTETDFLPPKFVDNQLTY